jgi:hypothetical protein
MYVHPWDLVDEGAERVLHKLTDLGINVINIATTYHSGRYLLPHNPKRRIYYAEEGVVYFSPNMHFYRGTRLKPHKSEIFKDADVLRLLSEPSSRYGVEINGWTVALHNSLLGRTHPDAVITNLYGDKEFNHLCPNHPDARKYLMSLLTDLASSYDLHSITLESGSFPWGIQHGDHHEMFGVLMEPVLNELLSSCFCNYCVVRAKEWGIDLRKVRETGKKMVDTSLNFPVSESVSEDERLRSYHSLSVGVPQVLDLIRFKMLTTQEVVEDAKESIKRANPRVELHVMVQGVFSREVGVTSKSSEGVSLSEVAKVADAINLITFVQEPQTVLYHVRWSKFEVGRTRLIASIRPNYPMAYTPANLLAQIENVFTAGADGIGFHSYGMTPLSQFTWIREGLKRQRSKAKRAGHRRR